MKKVLFVIAFTAICMSAYCQGTYGRAKLAKCPYCGHEKAIFNLISGSYEEGHMWWDLCTHYPMRQEPCAVQQCPRCFKYYVLSSVEVRDNDEGPYVKGTAGELTFSQLKKAWKQMHDTLKGEPLIELAMLCIHRYNDFHCEWPWYIQVTAKHPRTEKDRQFAIEVVNVLISNYKAENPLIFAQWLCNVGEFDRARGILEKTERPKEMDCYMNGLDYAKLYDILTQCCNLKDSRVRLVF